jgi:hypothetical protein
MPRQTRPLDLRIPHRKTPKENGDTNAMKISHKNAFVITALLGILLSCSGEARGQKNFDVCRVTTSTWSLSGGIGTGIVEIGKFSVDDIEDGIERSFRYETDGRTFSVDVEVEYGDSRDVDKGKPTRIILSLLATLSGEKNASPPVRPVEAGASYRYKWGTVHLSNDVVTGDVAQSFTLTCSDGISKTGVKRGEPEWLKKSKQKKND